MHSAEADIDELTPKGLRTRELILSTATRLFAEQGFQATSLRAIAAAANLSHATLLRYFADKDALLLVVLQRRDAEGLAVMGLRGPAAATTLTSEQARALLQDALELIALGAHTPHITELFLKVAAEATAPEHPAHHYMAQRYRMLSRFFEFVLRAACPTEGVDPALAARHLIAILDGSQIQWLLAPDELDVANEARSYLELVGIDLG